MTRNARQMKIIELISQKDIETQDELAAELVRAHFNVTQATISRDIKELGLVKVTMQDGRQRYAKETSERNVSGKIINLFKNAVVSINNAVNLVVIKTLTGSASTAGLMIDKLANPGVLGCVAGDDTVLIVTKTEEVAQDVVATLNELILT